MKYEIKAREMGWGILHEMRLDDWKQPVATLTIDRGLAFGPREPNINWSAIGSQPAEVAKAFAAGLVELTVIADSYSKDQNSDSNATQTIARNLV